MEYHKINGNRHVRLKLNRSKNSLLYLIGFQSKRRVLLDEGVANPTPRLAKTSLHQCKHFCTVYHVHLKWRGVDMLSMNMADKDVVLRENLMFSDDLWLFPNMNEIK